MARHCVGVQPSLLARFVHILCLKGFLLLKIDISCPKFSFVNQKDLLLFIINVFAIQNLFCIRKDIVPAKRLFYFLNIASNADLT